MRESFVKKTNDFVVCFTRLYLCFLLFSRIIFKTYLKITYLLVPLGISFNSVGISVD